MIALLLLPLQLGGAIDIAVERTPDDELCTVRARDAAPADVLAALAHELGRELTGLASPPHVSRITVELLRRPADQAVHYVLGCSGLEGALTPASIEIRPSPGAETPISSKGLDDAAEVAYLRALKTFPAHPMSARAEMSLGEIEERRGNLPVARYHYALVAERYPGSDLAPEAALRSSRLLQALGRWSDAWTELSALVNTDPLPRYQVEARLGLARTSLALGDARQAAYLLDALDNLVPAEEPDDLAQRLRLRAEVEIAGAHAGEAVLLLDRADAADGDRIASLGLRARALEAAGRPDAAARAWLTASLELGPGHAPGASHADALASAARLASEAGDDVAVLFIDRLAGEHGEGEGVAPWTAVARDRLGLPTADPFRVTAAEDVLRAERLLEQSLDRQAFEALDPLLPSRERYDEPLRTRILLAYARAADGIGELDRALGALRGSIGSLRDVESRRRVYVLAGELLEGRGRFDEAIEAYQGRL